MVVDSVGATWITISWDSGSVDEGITGYIVTAAVESGDVSVTVDGSETSANVTGLQPETEYTLTVISVRDGEESLPSDPILGKTLGIQIIGTLSLTIVLHMFLFSFSPSCTSK